jgi:hypothetical protein
MDFLLSSRPCFSYRIIPLLSSCIGCATLKTTFFVAQNWAAMNGHRVSGSWFLSLGVSLRTHPMSSICRAEILKFAQLRESLAKGDRLRKEQLSKVFYSRKRSPFTYDIATGLEAGPMRSDYGDFA